MNTAVAQRINSGETGVAMLAGCGAAVLLVLLVASDLSSRALLGEPFAWSVEISGYLMAALALFGFAYAEHRDANIRVELGLDIFSRPTRSLVERMGRWLALVLVMVAAWSGAEFCYTAWVNGQRTFGIIETPLWIPLLALAPAFVLLALELARAACAPHQRGNLIAVAGVLAVAVVCLMLRKQQFAMFGIAVPMPAMAIAVIVTAMAAVISPREGVWTLAVMCAISAATIATRGLSPMGQGAWLATLLCVLLFFGVQIAYTLGLCALAGVLFILPAGQLAAMPERIWGATNSFELTAVPTFVLMGVLLLQSGITGSVFRTLASRLQRIPGGLAHASVFGCAIFSTVSGSSMATAATMGTVACPEMLNRGYDRRLAFGAVAAGGTLGILIPPSIAMIIYGSVVGASVTSLFTAGFIPGLVLVLLFLLVIQVWAAFLPKVPQEPLNVSSGASGTARGDTLRLVSFAGLIFTVLGSIYVGLATPTEAGAIGVIGALAICAVMRTLSWAVVREALLETLQVTAMLMLIVAFASVLTYVLDFTGTPKMVVQALTPLVGQPLLLFLALCAVYCVLGMFIEPVSMMLITLPVVFPLVTAAGFDPVWFGIVLVVLMEVGLLTPPIGVNLFVIKGIVPSATLSEISWGALPFVGAMFVLLAALYVWPEIALWLPSMMR
jgi:tripartite ATP-independent transporter DctM subunit